MNEKIKNEVRFKFEIGNLTNAFATQDVEEIELHKLKKELDTDIAKIKMIFMKVAQEKTQIKDDIDQLKVKENFNQSHHVELRNGTVAVKHTLLSVQEKTADLERTMKKELFEFEEKCSSYENMFRESVNEFSQENMIQKLEKEKMNFQEAEKMLKSLSVEIEAWQENHGLQTVMGASNVPTIQAKPGSDLFNLQRECANLKSAIQPLEGIGEILNKTKREGRELEEKIPVLQP